MVVKPKVRFAPPKTGGGFRFPVEDISLPIKDCYNSNHLVKKGHTQQAFTTQQMIEIAKCRANPIYFATTYLRIVSIDDGLIPFRMFDFQKDMLRQYFNNRFSLTVTARQMGKTTTVAAFMLWYALFNENKECAILANKADQSKEVIARVRSMFEYLPFFLQAGVTSYNVTSVEFDNGSQIFSAATSTSSIRGRSIALLYIDEAAFIENDYDFYTSTYPVITSGEKSRVIMTSTPKGKRGMFYDLYKGANDKKNSYKTITVTWDHHPRRNEAWKEETIKNTSQTQFDQEFCCSFLGSSGTLIPGHMIEKMDFVNPINEDDEKDYKIYAEPKPNSKYVAVADVAGGVGQDYSVCTVFDVTEIPYTIAAKYRNNEIDTLQYPNIIVGLAEKYNQAPLLIEANNDCGGQVAYIVYHELEYENVVLTRPDAKGQGAKAGVVRRTIPGVKTTVRVKKQGCYNLKALIENEKLLVNDFDTISELGTFIAVRNSYEADQNCNDDCVMTLVLFSWFVVQDFFKEYSESDVRKSILDTNSTHLLEQLTPLGIMPRGLSRTFEMADGSFIAVTEGPESDLERWFNS